MTTLLTADLAELTGELRRSTVKIVQHRHGIGSGVVWNEKGIIITNAHVARHSRMQVETSDGRVIPAWLEKRDDTRDLAALAVDTRDLRPAQIAASHPLRVGDVVVAVGNPLGITGAAVAGIIHGIGTVEGFEHQSWIQADIRLAPGNSGGPLADARGRVIGVNSMINRGLGMAVPSDSVQRFLSGEDEQPKLGVTIETVRLQPVPDQIGLLIADIDNGSVAKRAGLQMGDVLVAAGDKPFRRPTDLMAALRSASKSQPIRLSLIRAGRQLALEVVVRS